NIHSLYVYFSGEELQVGPSFGMKGVPLSGMDQLRSIRTAAHEQLEDARRRRQKHEKIRHLKERSIQTQVEAEARRLGFEFVIERMQTKLKLIIRIDEKNGMVLDLPHSRIEEPLQDLERVL